MDVLADRARVAARDRRALSVDPARDEGSDQLAGSAR
jgi:hypothetical protein